MRILFAGTPDFATPTLRMLLDSGHEVCGVFCQPDRPAGRGRKLKACPVKELALEQGLPVCQPESLRDPADQELMRSFRPDLLVVVAYGLILPRAVLSIPRLGCVNVHASLLPRWRGAAPIQRSVLAGDAETGVTIMFIEPKLDAGPMLRKAPCPLLPLETAGELHDRLAVIGAEAMQACLPGLETGSLVAEPQDESLVTYAEKLDKGEALIDWTKPAIRLERQVRAFNPWPVAETVWQGQVLRIWRAEALDESADGAPGHVLARAGSLDVVTGQGLLRILELQLPGGKRMATRAFLNAHDLVSARLGPVD